MADKNLGSGPPLDPLLDTIQQRDVFIISLVDIAQKEIHFYHKVPKLGALHRYVPGSSSDQAVWRRGRRPVDENDGKVSVAGYEAADCDANG